MFKNIDNLIGFIQLGVYLISLVSAYWIMKSDIKILNKRINDIEKDREEKWNCYNRKQDKQDNFLQKMMTKFEEVSGDIKEIKTNIDWLKKK